jgi:N-acetyl-anhydromuramyl-L-alanine amidase AmpD
MGDNKGRKGTGRFSIVDPNDMGYQYNGGMFGNTNYNMSVPPEELCIIVELVTTQKARSVLINSQNGKEIKNSEGNKIANFINGKKDGSTGYGNFLTTSYTDLGTETIIEEALGITNIQIEFNSSYAPMVNIDFIDVKGGAIFQSGAKSIYNVLFRLPYPLFELKIKGFYGKPVVYCLHMVKCNTRFNSQTGNFEISASFVGYTYAMFADMILGYLRAAVRTSEGEKLLKDKDTISINQFMKDMNNIDKLVEEQLANTSNVNRNNVALANELQGDLNAIESLVDSFIADIKNPSISETPLGDTPEPYNTSIVFFPDPGTSDADRFSKTKAYKLYDTFATEYKTKRDAYNTKSGDLEGAKLNQTEYTVGFCIAKVNDLIGPNGGVNNTDLSDYIKENYGDLIDGNNTETINSVITRLQNAAPKTLSPSDAYFQSYDVTETRQFIQDARKELGNSQKVFTDALALDIADAIESKLTFEPNIRNIFKMFTAHIEIFLELMFQVSSKYLEKTRIDELKKFRSKDKAEQRLDIKNTEDAVIYPWPEYIEKDEEKYLGGAGVLANPLLVPEIKFVEELYAQMVRNIQEDEAVQASENGVPAWQAFNPIDTIKSIPDKTPYDRLPDSATQDDIARLIVLRAVGVLGWQPSGVIDDKEIESFAKAEAELIIQKYKTNSIILPALTNNYDTVDKYIAVKGKVDGAEKLVLFETKQGTDDVIQYDYIGIPFKGSTPFTRYELPVDKGFTDVTGPYYGNYSDFKLSNRSGGVKYDDTAENADTAKYINFIDFNTYDQGTSTSPIPSGPSIFKYEGLSKDITTSVEMTDGAGFFLSNGKYGVQEFTTIDYLSKPEYGTNGNLSFFSLFYDNPLIEVDEEIGLPGLSTLRIEPIGALSLDISFSGGNFGAYQYTTDGFLLGLGTSYLTDWYFLKLSQPNNNHESVAKNITLFNNETSKGNVCFPFLNFGIYSPDGQYGLSLFGSRFYNAQTSYSAKTFLFLHSFPWRGLMGKAEKPSLGPTDKPNLDDVGIFLSKEIINTFQWRSGYIQVPKLWSAFIGGLLWRFHYGATDPINFTGPTSTDYLIPYMDSNTVPKQNQFLKNAPINYPMCFNSEPYTDYKFAEYPKIDDVLLQLPPPAKKHFIDEFSKFVTEFENVHSKILELKPKGVTNVDDTSWKTAWDAINTSTEIITSIDTLKKHDIDNLQDWVATNTPANLNKNLDGATPDKLEDDYAILTYNYYNPADKTVNGVDVDKTDNKNNYNFYVEYKQGGKIDTKLKELFFTKQYIENYSVLMWAYYNQTAASPRFFKTKFTKYIETINQALKTKVTDDQKTIVSPGENEKIKLEIYRTCKKIYDKWIAGVGGSPRPFNDILFQCCSKGTNEPYRLTGDTAINAKYGKGTGLNLIDSFRFVTRSFEDISEQFQIHPVMVTHQLYESPDTSIYDLFGRILTDNNFEFIALPNFINFNDPKELHSVFEPYPYYMAQKQTATGPSFVCVYVGQTSTKLDFGQDSQYPNDGFDITNENTWPEDFSQEKASWEDFASAFVVRYGQQNQNIFKDIRLDQSEFNETAESLAITDAISNSLSSANQSYIGQNLYNVYSVRSYKAEVEMMGDAMIQPMMYFQLDNIPMFHGAYLITKVTHNIVPNNMTTVFTGTRIRIAKTPLIDKATLYSSLISGQKIGTATAGSTITSSSQGNFGHIPLPAQQIGNVTVSNLKQSAVMLNSAGNYRDGYPEYIVLHWTAGVNFATPTPNGVGYHFEIDTNGDIIKTCELTGIASHAGCFSKKSEKIGRCAQLNAKSIGISYVGGIETGKVLRVRPDGVKEYAAYVRTWDDWQQTNLSLGLGTYNAKEQWNSIINAILLAKQKHPTINAITSHHLTSDDKADVGDNFPWDTLFDEIEKRTTAMGTPWRPKFADRWYDDSGSNNLGKLVREFKPNSVNALENADLLTTLMPASTSESNQPTGSGGLTSVQGLDETSFWLYMSWQQGADGAAQHYKIANGAMAAYKSNVPASNMINNWPGSLVADNGVKKSDINTLYNSDPKKLANGYINVWSKHVSVKYGEAISLINSSAKDGLNRPFLRLKDIFKKYEKPNDSLTWDRIALMGYVENSLLTYSYPYATPNSGPRAGMYSMLKAEPTFIPYITRSFKGNSGYVDKTGVAWEEYDIDIMTEGFVKLAIDNFNLFKKISGFVPSSNSVSSAQSQTRLPSSSSISPTTLDTIIIGDSHTGCIELNIIKKGGKARRISPTGGEASLWLGGKGLDWLLTALKKYPTSTAVKNVVISIGTNGGFNTRDNQSGLMTELKRVFPNAKYIFVKGSYGWGGNINKTALDVSIYYQVFAGLGAKVIEGIGQVTDAKSHNCDLPNFPTITSNIIGLVGG